MDEAQESKQTDQKDEPDTDMAACRHSQARQALRAPGEESSRTEEGPLVGTEETVLEKGH